MARLVNKLVFGTCSSDTDPSQALNFTNDANLWATETMNNPKDALCAETLSRALRAYVSLTSVWKR